MLNVNVLNARAMSEYTSKEFKKTLKNKQTANEAKMFAKLILNADTFESRALQIIVKKS